MEHQLKITAPIKSVEEVRPVLEAGADEIYCGLHDQNLSTRFDWPYYNNRRQSASANLESLDMLQKVISIANKEGGRVSLALNDWVYHKNQYSLMVELIKNAIKIGISTIILAEPRLMIEARSFSSDIRVHASTSTASFNSSACRFFFELGVDRVILPRQMRIDQISELTRNAPGEYEVIVMHDACQNTDGLCYWEHDLHRWMPDIPPITGGCGIDCKTEVLNITNKEVNKNFDVRALNKEWGECGFCDLAGLSDAGVTVFKCAGRAGNLAHRTNSIKALKSLADQISQPHHDSYKAQAIKERRNLIENTFWEYVCGLAQIRAEQDYKGFQARCKDIRKTAIGMLCQTKKNCYFSQ